MRYLKEYAEELQRVGEEHFRKLYGKHALIGVGMIGMLKDNSKEAKRRPTVLSQFTDDESVVETEALRNRVWLIVRTDTGRRSTGITFGRGRDNDLIIPEYSISNHHGEFTFVDREIFIGDLGSMNGTFVNNQKLEQERIFPLHDGSKLILGRFQFYYHSDQSFVQRVAHYPV